MYEILYICALLKLYLLDIFYSDNICGDRIFLSAEESSHCIRVMRNKIGDEVKVSGGDGNLYRCIVTKDDPKGAELHIEEVIKDFGTHDYYLHIAVAPTKHLERFEWFLEKATEMGIDEITPILCDHSQRRVFKTERGERILLSASKQSLKGVVPRLNSLTPVIDFIRSNKDFKGKKSIAYCDPELLNSEGDIIKRVSIEETLCQMNKGEKRMLFMIGPEGDFSQAEITAAADEGFIPISLGESRLRTETAATLCAAACYLRSITII